MFYILFYNKAETKVCSDSCQSWADECVCVHILNCWASIRVEMNGLSDLKMYSRYDCHCRLRIDKPSDVCTYSVGGCSHFLVWEARGQIATVAVQWLRHVNSQDPLGKTAPRIDPQKVFWCILVNGWVLPWSINILNPYSLSYAI